MFKSTLRRLDLRRINVFTRDDGNKIIVPKRRDMSLFTSQPTGVKTFTSSANARNRAAARARNKRARKARRINRVH